MKTAIKCEITKADLKILYDKLCVDKNTEDTYCNKCPLGHILCIIGEKDVYKYDWSEGRDKISETVPLTTDLCFAIWHDKILTKHPKHIHH